MRIAVISDIHGDLDSLRQVLTAIDRAATEQIWCLGDIVGLGATAPAEVVDLVRDRCALRSPATTTAGSLASSRSACCHCPANARSCNGSTVCSPTSSSHGSQRCPPRVALTTSSSGTGASRTQSPVGSQARKTRPIISPASKPGSGSSGTPTDRCSPRTTAQRSSTTRTRTATTSRTTVAQCSTPVLCSDHAGARTRPRSGKRDLAHSLNPGAA
jgi:Calcineurin-like phosphoesterase superfamily domain